MVHCPLLYSAAASDLDLFKRIRKFSKIHKKMARVAEKVLRRHTWYLTEELIPLCLFNSNLPEETLNNLAQQISELPEERHVIRKPILPDLTPSSTITDFVGPRSTVFFDILGVPCSFLKESDWRSSPDFNQIRKALKNLTPLNDSCERAVSTGSCHHIQWKDHQGRSLIPGPPLGSGSSQEEVLPAEEEGP